MGVSTELMNLLACPKCKGTVELDSAVGAILCHQCNLSYPVRDNIPVMLIDEANDIEK